MARSASFGTNSVLNLPFPAAVKTGTTTDWRDNWTVGYSTERLVGVWVGNADNSPMAGVSGVDGAGPIWHDIMRLAHPVAPPAFARPDGLVDVQICAPSGMLPAPECPRTRWEIFADGTQPTQPDTQYQRIAVDLATGLRATDATPANRRAEQVYRVLPPEYHDWMVAQGIAIAPPAVEAGPGDGVTTATAKRATSPLVLTNPAAHTAYQVHPGMPPAAQRLPVTGLATDGRLWAELRLVVDGDVVAAAQNAARLDGWWPLSLGAHRFWLEGEATAGAPTTRSSEASIRVDEFRSDQITYGVDP